jgi:2-amino-4-hydroxy-6-hydroxymethyldihydropteridine diphosphokinase
MAKVSIAVGTNLGNRIENLQKAATVLTALSQGKVHKSSVYETAPIGTANMPFLNAAAIIETNLNPSELLNELKMREEDMGRDLNAPRWSNRLIDFDIIFYGDLIFKNGKLKIPHPEFAKRLFVLIPLAEINSEIRDPLSNLTVGHLTELAPKMDVFKTALKW